MIKISKSRLVFNRAIAVIALVFALCSALLAGFFIIHIRVPVNGMSMYPTLNYNLQETNRRDVVYINRFKKPLHNDIVVLDLTDNTNFGNYSIKRLIAVEGDVVNIVADTENLQYNLIVNGAVVDHRPIIVGQVNECSTYINFINLLSEADSSQKTESGLKIGKNQIFVLGDNWNVSKDSSLYGTFNKNTLVGKVDFIIHSNGNEIVQLFKQIFD